MGQCRLCSGSALLAGLPQAQPRAAAQGDRRQREDRGLATRHRAHR